MTDTAKVALCVAGWAPALVEGRTYEVIPIPCTADGLPMFAVPKAIVGGSLKCHCCKQSSGDHWWRHRFIQINDPSLKIDTTTDEPMKEPA